MVTLCAPAPVRGLNVTIGDDGSAVVVSWQELWATIPGPWVGPNYHMLTLYLCALGSPLVQVTINGTNQFVPKKAGVPAQRADATEAVFTFTGTWSSPPALIVTGYGILPGSCELWLDAATYDGSVQSGIAKHYTVDGQQYRFSVKAPA